MKPTITKAAAVTEGVNNDNISGAINTESKNNIPIFGNLNKSNLKHYIPTAPIVYLINNNDSQVQTRQKDDSGLYKYYEQLNKDLYIISKRDIIPRGIKWNFKK